MMADEAYFDQDSNADSNKKSPNILRKRFSAFQLDILEDAFQNHNYLNADILDDLHHRLRLSENQIKIWFRDRRRKWRREMEAPPTERSTAAKGPCSSSPVRKMRVRVRDSAGKGKRKGKHGTRMKIVSLKCPLEDCDFKCTTKADMNRHQMHTHSRLPFPCRAVGCDRAFVYGYQLSTHRQKAHPDENGATIWQCDSCSKTFRTNSHLRVHVIRQHEVGSFACGHDGCTYVAPNHRDELQRHIYRAHVVAKFVCNHPNCERLFKTKANLKIHQSTHSFGPKKRGPPIKKATSSKPRLFTVTIPEHVLSQISDCSNSASEIDEFNDCNEQQFEENQASPLDLSVKSNEGTKPKTASLASSSIRDYFESFGEELAFTEMLESKEREIRDWITGQSGSESSSSSFESTDHTYCRLKHEGCICQPAVYASMPSPTPSVVYAGSLFSQLMMASPVKTEEGQENSFPLVNIPPGQTF